MAFLHLNVRCGFAWLGNKYPNLKTLFQCTINQRNKKYFNTVSLKSQSKCLVSQKVTHAINRFAGSTPQNQLSLDFDPACMSQCTITNEIQFFRDNRNDFHGLSFSNTKEPYGPPLAILLPWETLHMRNLKKFIQTYGEKGFDIVTVNLSAEQLMYPCVAGGAMNVVSDLLQYLNESHKHRPYIFHGFSVAAYIYGEIMAQFSDQYETYRSLMNNVKGCLWDSPVDILLAKPYIGKFFYPNNIFCRWRCNRAVKSHFKNHHHDSVCYWLRSRNNFCNPIIKVPQVFFVSYADVLSNPYLLQEAQKILDCNGIPIFQKTWCDSEHNCHFEKYFYEYLYGIVLFLNLSNFFPDECGKYRNCSTTASLTNLRLSKKARENICQ